MKIDFKFYAGVSGYRYFAEGQAGKGVPFSALLPLASNLRTNQVSPIPNFYVLCIIFSLDFIGLFCLIKNVV